jgi:hypothetical protein
MLKLRALTLCLGAIVLVAPSAAQRGHRDPPINVQDETHLPPASHAGPDYKLMQQQADELKQLGEAIPDDIHNVAKGVISKDLGQRLKRIEKLSKKLREEVGQ